VPLFRADASIRGSESVSRQIADRVEVTWRRTRADDLVVRRDLAAVPVPADAWQLALTAAPVAPRERTAEQEAALGLAATLADELLAADAYVLAVPLYNFGVAQHVKSWIDLLLCDPRLAPGRSAPLAERPALLVTARGGGYGPGSPRHGWDHATPYYRRILADVLKLDLRVIEAELTLADTNPAMAALRGRARDSLQAAFIAADQDGARLDQGSRLPASPSATVPGSAHAAS
jgi:FMN-dependent NADH-azoreductase